MGINEIVLRKKSDKKHTVMANSTTEESSEELANRQSSEHDSNTKSVNKELPRENQIDKEQSEPEEEVWNKIELVGLSQERREEVNCNEEEKENENIKETTAEQDENAGDGNGYNSEDEDSQYESDDEHGRLRRKPEDYPNGSGEDNSQYDSHGEEGDVEESDGDDEEDDDEEDEDEDYEDDEEEQDEEEETEFSSNNEEVDEDDDEEQDDEEEEGSEGSTNEEDLYVQGRDGEKKEHVQNNTQIKVAYQKPRRYPNNATSDERKENGDMEDENRRGEKGKQYPEKGMEKQGVNEDQKEDEEVLNPTIVPRRTGFWDHDNRFADISIEESRQPFRNRKLWDKTEVNRWEHDHYVESEQGPKEPWEIEEAKQEIDNRERRRYGNRNRGQNFGDFIPNSDNNNPSGKGQNYNNGYRNNRSQDFREHSKNGGNYNQPYQNNDEEFTGPRNNSNPSNRNYEDRNMNSRQNQNGGDSRRQNNYNNYNRYDNNEKFNGNSQRNYDNRNGNNRRPYNDQNYNETNQRIDNPNRNNSEGDRTYSRQSPQDKYARQNNMQQQNDQNRNMNVWNPPQDENYADNINNEQYVHTNEVNHKDKNDFPPLSYSSNQDNNTDKSNQNSKRDNNEQYSQNRNEDRNQSNSGNYNNEKNRNDIDKNKQSLPNNKEAHRQDRNDYPSPNEQYEKHNPHRYSQKVTPEQNHREEKKNIERSPCQEENTNRVNRENDEQQHQINPHHEENNHLHKENNQQRPQLNLHHQENHHVHQENNQQRHQINSRHEENNCVNREDDEQQHQINPHHKENTSVYKENDESPNHSREELPEKKTSKGRGRGVTDDNFKPVHRANDFTREKTNREKRIDQLAPRLRDKAREKMVRQEREKGKDVQEEQTSTEYDPDIYEDAEKDVVNNSQEVPRDKPKRYSSQRQKPGTSLMDIPAEIPDDNMGQHYDQGRMQPIFNSQQIPGITPLPQLQANGDVGKNIKILEQQIIQLQSQLQQQLNMRAHNVLPRYTTMPVHSPEMHSLPGNHLQQGQGYSMEQVYSMHNGMVQHPPQTDDCSQVNPGQLNQILAAVGYQQNMMPSGLFIPPQQPMRMNEYEYQQESRGLRPAAIPIRHPPGLQLEQ